MIGSLPVLINGYRFTKHIGKGGFSEVYLVESVRFQTVYCAKVVPLNSSISKDEILNIESEVNALKSLYHPNIIQLFDCFKHKKNYYTILEYCPGGSLAKEISVAKPLEYERWVFYAQQIIEALSFCHSRNIAHRDIKPGNVLLDRFGRIKLADFGISMQNANGGLVTQLSGTQEYNAPELIQKIPHDPFLADIWALGVLFAYMANGVSPWVRCENVGQLKYCINNAKFHIRRHVRKEIADVIKKMLVVKPSERITLEQLKRLPIFTDPMTLTQSDSLFDLNSSSPMISSSNTAIRMTKDAYSVDNLTETCSILTTTTNGEYVLKHRYVPFNRKFGYNKPVPLKSRMHTRSPSTTFFSEDNIE